MNVDRYRHNYEGSIDFGLWMWIYEKSIYQMSINRGRTTTTEGAHASLVKILSFLLFLSNKEL